ncbi:MAG TPA: glutathione S-transferase family protein [Candidatus Obscuribacterales bacterium]
MLKFYHHPLSPIARRVWLALLEKQIPFEAIVVDLKNRANLQPEYLAINPFHHVPVVVAGDLPIVESFAILDYLEAQFPSPPLLPSAPAAIAQTKMVQMVVANELMPKLPVFAMLEADASPDQAALDHVHTVMDFLTAQLGTADYFGGDRLSLADITAGATLPLIRRLGLDLSAYPALTAWGDRLAARPAWQQTEPSADDLALWQRWLTLMVKRRQQQMTRP